MASESEYLTAIGRVKYGGASQHDYELCEQTERETKCEEPR